MNREGRGLVSGVCVYLLDHIQMRCLDGIHVKIGGSLSASPPQPTRSHYYTAVTTTTPGNHKFTMYSTVLNSRQSSTWPHKTGRMQSLVTTYESHQASYTPTDPSPAKPWPIPAATCTSIGLIHGVMDHGDAEHRMSLLALVRGSGPAPNVPWLHEVF